MGQGPAAKTFTGSELGECSGERQCSGRCNEKKMWITLFTRTGELAGSY